MELTALQTAATSPETTPPGATGSTDIADTVANGSSHTDPGRCPPPNPKPDMAPPRAKEPSVQEALTLPNSTGGRHLTKIGQMPTMPLMRYTSTSGNEWKFHPKPARGGDVLGRVDFNPWKHRRAVTPDIETGCVRETESGEHCYTCGLYIISLLAVGVFAWSLTAVVLGSLSIHSEACKITRVSEYSCGESFIPGKYNCKESFIPIYLVVFGTINIVNYILAIISYFQRDKLATAVVNIICNITCLFLAGWHIAGVVIVFRSHPDASGDCDPSVYVLAQFTSLAGLVALPFLCCCRSALASGSDE